MKCTLKNKIIFVLVAFGMACLCHLEVVGSVEIDGASLSFEGTETTVDAPVAKGATEISATSFQANWTAVKGVDGYKLYVYKVGRGFVKTYITGYNPKAVAGATTIKTRVSGLDLATTYYFVLKAMVGKTESVLSNVISLKTSDIPDAPLATAATEIHTTSFQANWETSIGATGYKLTVYNNSLHEYVPGLTGIISGGSVDSFSVTGLAPDVSYSYYVKAVNDKGTSGISNWINLRTLTLKSLILSANPSEGGTVSGEETVGAGSPVTASATANEGYKFVNWTQNGIEVSSNASYTFNLDENAELVANFSLLKPDAPEIYGTSQVKDSSFWAEWRSVEDVSEYKLTVYTYNNSGDKVYLPDYNPKIITGFVGTYVVGLEPQTTYYWYVKASNLGGDSDPSDLQVVNTKRTGPELMPVVDITSSSCLVSWSPLEGALEYNLWVYINNGVYFEGYQPKSITETSHLVEGLSPNSNYYISVSAVFVDGNSMRSESQLVTTLAENTLSLQVSSAAGGSISGAGTFATGTTVTANATANDGYVFVNWTEGGTEVSTNAAYTFTLNEDRTLVANFAEVVTTNTLSLSVSPVEGGTVSGGATVNTGTSVTAQATANGGYVFVNWTEDGTEISTEASYTFTLNADRTLVANFRLTTAIDDKIGVDIKVWPNPASNSIYISGVPQGAVIKLTSMTGALALQKENCKELEILNITAVKNGIYIVTIENDIEYYSYKIIKR
jgi:hypothetical protein